MVHHPLSAQNQSEKALQSMPRRDGGPMGDHATSIFCYDDPRVVKRCTEKSYSVDLSIYIYNYYYYHYYYYYYYYYYYCYY